MTSPKRESCWSLSWVLEVDEPKKGEFDEPKKGKLLELELGGGVRKRKGDKTMQGKLKTQDNSTHSPM